jgi:hypothetical protein
LEAQVEVQGACSLPGVSICFDKFIPILQRAVVRGYVPLHKAQYVFSGLRYGFSLGIDVSLLRGRQRFRNYLSAMQARPQVSDSVRARVQQCKTVMLFPFAVADRNKLPWSAWRIFPLGAVPKPLEPDSMRPVSDHTRTGLKDATDMSLLKHSLNTYEEIAAYLKFGYFMSVQDVDAAFPLLPLAPCLWPFFLFHWFDVTKPDDSEAWCLYVHVCGDFGAAGLPGAFKIFFSDCVVGMARSELVLTLPMTVYVDDTGCIGQDQLVVDSESVAFATFCAKLGIFMKELKRRAAAQVQLMQMLRPELKRRWFRLG